MAKAVLPKDFVWGFATASFQIEGAPKADGKGPSIWDEFCATPGKIADKTNGDVACDSYNRWKEDIALLKQTGAKCYRFSIAWARIIPLGGRNDPVNEKGVQHYVKFIDALKEAGIEPMVTLYHWDLPLELYKRYDGFLNKEEFVADYVNYAKVLFEAFGSRVKYWITFNEPWCSTALGHHVGTHAPGRTSDRSKSPVGDSAREPWIVAHNILIAHGKAVELFREQYKPKNGGIIGITLNGDWAEAWDPEDPADHEAANRKLEFTIGWFGDPIYFGDYPVSVRKQIGDRLPKFTDDERALVKGSNDFYGMNTYTSDYIKNGNGNPPVEDIAGDVVVSKQNKAGDYIGPESATPWLRPHPPGFRKLLKWISDRFGRPNIYVTENGCCVPKENDLPLDQLLSDDYRCKYYTDYINKLVEAYTEDNVDVRSYMAWSLMDNFEWAEGYRTRFGVTYVDYEGGQKRIPKKSAKVVGELFNTLIKKD